MYSKLVSLGAAACVLASPAAAATYGVKLQGFVPVTCNVSTQNAVVNVNADMVEIGQVREFCNNAAGYTVHLDYNQSMTGAKLLVGGREIDLTDAGTVAFASEANAAIKTRDLSLDLAGVESLDNLQISFRISPR